MLTQAVLKDKMKNYQFQMKCTIFIKFSYEHQVERGQKGHNKIYLLMLFPLSGVIWV